MGTVTAAQRALGREIRTVATDVARLMWYTRLPPAPTAYAGETLRRLQSLRAELEYLPTETG